jgi:hypothetical protein
MGATSSRTLFNGILTKLLTVDVPVTDHEFWDDLWRTSLSVDELFELISADHIRRMILERPENLRTLFTQAVAQLYQVVETPYPVYFDQALNCARILARILPVMLESKSRVVLDMFWRKQVQRANTSSGDGNTESKESGDKDGDDNDTNNSKETFAVHETEPLAVILVNAIFHLLFLPDFTIEDPNMEFAEEDVNSTEFKKALMWSPGVGSTEKSVTHSTEFDMNRKDILRLMTAAFSDSLFQVWLICSCMYVHL